MADTASRRLKGTFAYYVSNSNPAFMRVSVMTFPAELDYLSGRVFIERDIFVQARRARCVAISGDAYAQHRLDLKSCRYFINDDAIDDGNFIWCLWGGIQEIIAEKLLYIGRHVFYNCSYLCQFVAPALTKLGREAFRGSGLTTAHFPKLESIGNECFADCECLREFRAESLRRLAHGSFNRCKRLSVLYLPNLKRPDAYGMFANDSIREKYFYGCDALNILSIHSGVVEK